MDSNSDPPHSQPSRYSRGPHTPSYSSHSAMHLQATPSTRSISNPTHLRQPTQYFDAIDRSSPRSHRSAPARYVSHDRPPDASDIAPALDCRYPTANTTPSQPTPMQRSRTSATPRRTLYHQVHNHSELPLTRSPLYHNPIPLPPQPIRHSPHDYAPPPLPTTSPRLRTPPRPSDSTQSNHSNPYHQDAVSLSQNKIHDRSGPPPKAKLGGPGGHTYDERIASRSKGGLDNDQRQQAEEMATPSPRSSKGDDRTSEDDIVFSLPPTHYSPPDTPYYLARTRVKEERAGGEGVRSRKEQYPWPKTSMRTSPTGVLLPFTSVVDACLIAQRDGNLSLDSTATQANLKNGTKGEKAVVVAIADTTSWEPLIEAAVERRRTASEEARLALEINYARTIKCQPALYIKTEQQGMSDPESRRVEAIMPSYARLDDTATLPSPVFATARQNMALPPWDESSTRVSYGVKIHGSTGGSRLMEKQVQDVSRTSAGPRNFDSAGESHAVGKSARAPTNRGLLNVAGDARGYAAEPILLARRREERMDWAMEYRDTSAISGAGAIEPLQTISRTASNPADYNDRCSEGDVSFSAAYAGDFVTRPTLLEQQAVIPPRQRLSPYIQLLPQGTFHPQDPYISSLRPAAEIFQPSHAPQVSATATLPVVFPHKTETRKLRPQALDFKPTASTAIDDEHLPRDRYLVSPEPHGGTPLFVPSTFNRIVITAPSTPTKPVERVEQDLKNLSPTKHFHPKSTSSDGVLNLRRNALRATAISFSPDGHGYAGGRGGAGALDAGVDPFMASPSRTNQSSTFEGPSVRLANGFNSGTNIVDLAEDQRTSTGINLSEATAADPTQQATQSRLSPAAATFNLAEVPPSNAPADLPSSLHTFASRAQAQGITCTPPNRLSDSTSTATSTSCLRAKQQTFAIPTRKAASPRLLLEQSSPRLTGADHGTYERTQRKSRGPIERQARNSHTTEATAEARTAMWDAPHASLEDVTILRSQPLQSPHTAPLASVDHAEVQIGNQEYHDYLIDGMLSDSLLAAEGYAWMIDSPSSSIDIAHAVDPVIPTEVLTSSLDYSHFVNDNDHIKHNNLRATVELVGQSSLVEKPASSRHTVPHTVDPHFSAFVKPEVTPVMYPSLPFFVPSASSDSPCPPPENATVTEPIDNPTRLREWSFPLTAEESPRRNTLATRTDIPPDMCVLPAYDIRQAGSESEGWNGPEERNDNTGGSLKGSQGQTVTTREQLDALVESLRASESERKRLSSQSESYEKEKKELVRERDGMISSNESKDDIIASLHAMVGRQRAQGEAVKEQHASIRNNLDETLASYASKVQDIRKELQDVKIAMDAAFQGTLQEKERALREQRQTLNEKAVEYLEVESEREKLKDEVRRTQQEFDDLKMEAAKLRTLRDIADSQHRSTSIQLEQEREKWSRVEAQMQAVQLELDQAREEKISQQMTAIERQLFARNQEARLISVTQECAYWRHFALEADSRMYRSFVGSQPFAGFPQTPHPAASPAASSPEIMTPSIVRVEQEGRTPTQVKQGGRMMRELLEMITK